MFPAVANLGRLFSWVPTIQMTFHFLAHPKPGTYLHSPHYLQKGWILNLLNTNRAAANLHACKNIGRGHDGNGRDGIWLRRPASRYFATGGHGFSPETKTTEKSGTVMKNINSPQEARKQLPLPSLSFFVLGARILFLERLKCACKPFKTRANG